MNYWIEGTTLQFLLAVQDVYSDPTSFIDPDGLLYSGATVTDLGTLEITITGQPAAVPTLTRLAEGQYVVSFAGLSALAGDSMLTVIINGSLYGEAWSPYVLAFFIRRDVDKSNVVSMANNVVTASAIAAAALNDKGNWNIGKTGYELTSGERTAIGAAVWANGTRTLSAFAFGVTVAAINNDVITAASIAAGALNGKGNWNIGKTGYELTSGERTLIGTAVWANATRTLSAFSFNVTVGTLANNVITAASIAAGALNDKGNWNVGKTGYELTSGERTSIGTAVWANGTRTLSAFGFDVNVGSIEDDAVTADVIAAGALNGKGDWTTDSDVLDVNVITVDGTPVVSRDMEITILGSRPSDNTLHLTRGDAYTIATSTQIVFTKTDYPDLSGLQQNAAKLSIKDTSKTLAGPRLVLDHASSTSINPTTKTIVFELNGTQTLLDPSHPFMFDIELHYNSGAVVTIHRGPCVVFSNLENDS